MKRAFLLIVLSTLLVTLGFAQTPDAWSTLDPANVKGCLAGSDGTYTVTEDGTHQIFKITTSRVDLKPHLGHDVKLTGHKAGGAVSSGTADNSFAVTELSMISEHCAAAAAATTAALIPPSETVITPVQDATAPSATASAPAAGRSPHPAQLPAHQLRTPLHPVQQSILLPRLLTRPRQTLPHPRRRSTHLRRPRAAHQPRTLPHPHPLPQPHPLRQRPSATIANPPAVYTAAPAATVNPPAATASAPAADTDHPTRHFSPCPQSLINQGCSCTGGESWPTRGHGHPRRPRMPPRLARLRTRPAQPLRMPQLPWHAFGTRRNT